MTVPLADVRRLCANSAAILWRSAWQFVYLDACPLCGAEPAPGDAVANRDAHSFTRGPRFCAACCDELATETGPTCRRCAAPAGPFVDTSHGCVHCDHRRFQFESAVKLGVYEGPLRQVCLCAKRPAGQDLAVAAANLLWERKCRELEQAGIDVVVPVPRHWTDRIRAASHTPSTLSRTLSSRLQAEDGAHILTKIRRTLPQTALPPSRRRVNLKGAFRVPEPPAVANRNVLLVDDVMTTGSTAHECAQTLRKSGARRVVVAVLARGLRR